MQLNTVVKIYIELLPSMLLNTLTRVQYIPTQLPLQYSCIKFHAGYQCHTYAYTLSQVQRKIVFQRMSTVLFPANNNNKFCHQTHKKEEK